MRVKIWVRTHVAIWLGRLARGAPLSAAAALALTYLPEGSALVLDYSCLPLSPNTLRDESPYGPGKGQQFLWLDPDIVEACRAMTIRGDGHTEGREVKALVAGLSDEQWACPSVIVNAVLTVAWERAPESTIPPGRDREAHRVLNGRGGA